MYIVSPSGYWGAKRSIRHAGKKKTAINAPDANATKILEAILNLFDMIRVLKTSVPTLGSGSEEQQTLAIPGKDFIS